ncbi:hypothetical protein D9M71_497050 [compost metagenome]
MPDDTALVRAPRTRSLDHLIDRCPHGMELVITGDLLHQPPVIFEQHEVAQVIEQHLRRKNPSHQGFQLVELP